MKSSSGGSEPDVTPKDFPNVSPKASDMPAYSASVLFEMNHALGRIEGSLATVVKNTDDIESRLKAIEHNAIYVKGAIAAAVILVPLCVTVLYWAMSEKIDNALHALDFVQSDKK